MRYFNTRLNININIQKELEAAIEDALFQLEQQLSLIPETIISKQDFRSDYDRLQLQEEAIVNAYYEDIKGYLVKCGSICGEKINAIHFGKMQLHTLLDILLIEGTVNGENDIILTKEGFPDMKEVVLMQEIKQLTHAFLHKVMRESADLPDMGDSDVFSVMDRFYDRLTMHYLHKAIDKLNKEKVLDQYLKIRPFHFYYGEPNYYYHSIYYCS